MDSQQTLQSSVQTPLVGSGEVTDDVALVAQLCDFHEKILATIARRIVGQSEVISHLLVTLLAGGHGLFVGVPGLAKTLLIHTLADTLGLEFNRIQFTPDLMPSDITGTDIIEQDDTGGRSFRFARGPVFCNILLADEINRTPPKTQAALLQSMQEGRVTATGKTYDLARPFHVFATQNPIEQEGTYPLPEAQLDRFMMMMNVDYPSFSEEVEVVRNTTGAAGDALDPLLDAKTLLEYQALVRRVPIADHLIAAAVKMVRSSRPGDDHATGDINEYVSFGAGPRAAQHLVLAAKARAILSGRTVVDIEDIKALAKPVMRHRVLLNFHAEAQKITTDQLVDAIVISA